jgi:hypothetical protein
MTAHTRRKTERIESEQRSIFFVVALILLFLFAVKAVAQDEGTARKRVTIRSSIDHSVGDTKAESTTRPGRDGQVRNLTRRVTPSAMDPAPTELNLSFPTLVYPGEEVRGRLKFNDPDDYVFSIFITVFFPDGDVVTDTLYDYRIDGGDIWKGSINFWVEIPESETPLPGKIIITCSDEYLNVSEVTTNFVQFF